MYTTSKVRHGRWGIAGLLCVALLVACAAPRPMAVPAPPSPPPPPQPMAVPAAQAPAQPEREVAEQVGDATGYGRRGSTEKQRGGPVRPAIDPKLNYARMRVFYATDRGLAADQAAAAPAERFTGERGVMRYGQAFVSIPRGHEVGELEAPSIWRLEFREDPARHVVLLETTMQPRDAFLQEVRARVEGSKGKSAFIFVHGYNVSFADAARRTAQMAYDLSFDGAPIFFSWPSQASLKGYTRDEANIEWSTAHIKRFIIDAAERSGAQNIYLVGHSMGTRGLTRAVATLMLERPDLKGRFREIILAAPDIDADVFRTELAPALVKAGRRVTLYASSKDMALKASKEVHGYARAGDTADGIVVVRGMDTIDASLVDDSILAHSYFVESIPVIRDIAQMIRGNQPPAERPRLKTVRGPAGIHWLLEPAPGP